MLVLILIWSELRESGKRASHNVSLLTINTARPAFRRQVLPINSFLRRAETLIEDWSEAKQAIVVAVKDMGA